MGDKVTPVLFSSAIAVSVGVYVFYLKKKKLENTLPVEWERIGIAKNLFIYPLKSGHYIDVDSVECTEVGFKLLKSSRHPLQLRDRSFFLYDDKFEVKSGKNVPSIGKIEISVHDEYHVALDAPQMRTLYVKIPDETNENTFTVKVSNGKKIEGVDCGDEAARWMSHHISQKDSGYRLGYFDASQGKNLGLFSDVTSVMAVNHASISEFKTKSTTTTLMDFRPNIVIDDIDMKANDEDNWCWLKIGENVILKNVKQNSICAGNSWFNYFNKFLKTFNNEIIPEKPALGVNMTVKKPGIINVGDLVFIGNE